jgi:hypothetical protein
MNVRSSTPPNGGIYKMSEDYLRVDNHESTNIQQGIIFKRPLETRTGRKSKTKPGKTDFETALGFELTRNNRPLFKSMHTGK